MSDRIDLLILTALGEEAQVVSAVLDIVGRPLGIRREPPIEVYEFSPTGTIEGTGTFRIAAASAHEMGAVAMSILATLLFQKLKPAVAVLVGIAAAVDTEQVAICDVPFATHVYSYDDIAVQRNKFTIRSGGYPADAGLQAAAGRLRTNAEDYAAWRATCCSVIDEVVTRVNGLRGVTMTVIPKRPLPNLVTERIAGGPFLIRDHNFRDSLTGAPQKKGPHPSQGEKRGKPITFTHAIHPKLVSVDMESHGFMKAAHVCRVRASVLKGISDDGDDNKQALEKQSKGFFRLCACSNAVIAALNILPHIPRGRHSTADYSHYEIISELSGQHFLDGNPVSFVATFRQYATLATLLANDENTEYVLWTVNGSPLDESGWTDNEHCLTPWDKHFESLQCNKMRVVIFRNETEQQEYMEVADPKLSKRRAEFERSCGSQLRFTSVEVLKNRFPGLCNTVSFDIGFVSKAAARDDNSGTCFFSEFVTSKYLDERNDYAQLVIFNVNNLIHASSDYYKTHHDAKTLLERSAAYQALVLQARTERHRGWLFDTVPEVPRISERSGQDVV